MDDFDRLVKIPSRQDILDRVDEYTLYRYYTDIEDLTPNKAAPSPFRIDKVPSFTIFHASRGRGFDEFEYTWKDHGLGQAGNIFKLIKLIYNFNSYEEVYRLINQDFELGLSLPGIEVSKIKLFECPPAIQSDIRVHSIPFTQKGLRFWQQLDVSPALLKEYNAGQTDCYWAYQGQAVPSDVMDPTFYYQIGKYYQLYSPYASRENKHRNNLPPNYFFGYLQLPRNGDVLVIDKSPKDSIFCRTINYWAVCGKAETTEIPEPKMLELHERFPTIYLTLDPDAAGMRMTEKYMAKYPWLKPRFLSQAKDKTDLRALLGKEEARRIIHQLLQ